jgi:hypothetical protein
MGIAGDKARDKEAELKRVADADDPDDKVPNRRSSLVRSPLVAWL